MQCQVSDNKILILQDFKTNFSKSFKVYFLKILDQIV